jgi:glycosyltransferase involved in cell wall biosynthesis
MEMTGNNVVTSLSIVVPAYNESSSVLDLLGKIEQVVAPLVSAFEIIVVDDGSRDGTGELVEKAASVNSHIRVIRHRENRGKGAALRLGFGFAKLEWILFLDADDQISITVLPSFLAIAKNNDIIIGLRSGRPDNVVRLFLSWVFQRLVARTLDLRITDLNCPFKLFRRSLLEGLELSSSGFLIDVELLYLAQIRGARIAQVDVQSRRRAGGASSVRFYHAYETIKELSILRRRVQARAAKT